MFRYLIIAVAMFGAWTLVNQFGGAHVHGLSLPVLLIVAAIVALAVSNRVK